MGKAGGWDLETLIVRTGVAVLILVVGIVFFFMFRAGRSAGDAASVSRAWMEDVASERYGDAYQRLALAYRGNVGLDSFRDGVSQNSFLRGMQGFRTYETEAGRDRVRIRGEIESMVGPAETTFHLVREEGPQGDVWRISGVVVSGQPALPLADGTRDR